MVVTGKNLKPLSDPGIQGQLVVAGGQGPGHEVADQPEAGIEQIDLNIAGWPSDLKLDGF